MSVVNGYYTATESSSSLSEGDVEVVRSGSEESFRFTSSADEAPYYENNPYTPPRQRHPLHRLVCWLVGGFQRGVLMIPVILVLAIIGLDFYSLMFVEIPKRYSNDDTFYSVIVLLFIPDICLVLISYIRTMFTSSAVSDNPPPSYLNTGACLRCRKCSALKPLRTHHCSICKQCVLKMDHHCPWVANCVGFYNYKFFCLFVLYAALGCIIFIVGTWRSVFGIFTAEGSSSVITLVAFVVSLIFAITLVMFGGFHISMVLRNITTIEFGQDSLYDKGSRFNNWRTVFGPDPLLWFLPVQTLESHKGWGWKIEC